MMPSEAEIDKMAAIILAARDEDGEPLMWPSPHRSQQSLAEDLAIVLHLHGYGKPATAPAPIPQQQNTTQEKT